MNVASPKILLHLEGLVVLVLCCTLYGYLHYSWMIFAALLFAPDLSMLGFLIGKKTGTICYNIFHTYSIPIVIFLILFCLGNKDSDGIMLIWVAHVGLDRMLGYGIKYETAFKDTHLQRI